MPEQPDQHKLYGEKEISALLKRAAELQASDPSSDRPGLSLQELEQIAAEAGIDPRYVRAAAAATGQTPEPDRAAGLLGGPLSIEDERIFHGEVTPDQWEQMVQEIRRTFGRSGMAGQLGHSLEWDGEGRRHFRQAHVTVSPRNGRTRVVVSQTHGKSAFLYYYLTGWIAAGAAGIALSALNMAPTAEAAIIGGGVLAYAGLIRTFFGQWTRDQKHRIKDLMDRLEHIAEEPAAPTAVSTEVPTGTAIPAPVPATTPVGRIELPDEPAQEAEPDAPLRERTRS